MLEPVIEEDENDFGLCNANPGHGHDSTDRRASDVLVLQKGIKSISQAVQAYKQSLPPSLTSQESSHDGFSPSHAFQNHNLPRFRRRTGQPYRIAQPTSLSLTTQYPTPPPPSSRLHLNDLSEKDLLAALQAIRKEEEARMHTRRKSFHIVDFDLPLPPFSPLRVPFSPSTCSSRRPSTSTVVSTTSTSSTSSSRASTLLAPVTYIAADGDRDRGRREERGQEMEKGNESEEDGVAPYAECGTHQLVHAKERLRDLEQQLQDAVCCLQDCVQAVLRRPGGGTAERVKGQRQPQQQPNHQKQEFQGAVGNGARQGTAPVVVDALQDKLARLGRAHERVATEHALVTAEIKARAPGVIWDGTMEALARMARGDREMETE
ncbi:hypothetical protein SODALDRAFT_335277 [Sodiomyces alkalinus F11]|uniref:Uncharacterized protein n=1 Tax=Sodiomyces alkalinus (strain CBS 110278 / VKM F-3762 / F11) TaxID=1314773 RepID=A0A3N2PNW1_SODAK|nr:hypothetical protein SODALDRAFT_335277 [Sodiomyces alkalinus F11]ROT36207.1 hypothetical protein SODALDRAFT_335277 [Sodiomyces alkalinus F11]